MEQVIWGDPQKEIERLDSCSALLNSTSVGQIKYVYIICIILWSVAITGTVSAQDIDLSNQGPELNSMFPSFDYVSIDGDSIRSSDYTDKILVINIWFVGCRGCKQEEELLKQITAEYKGDDRYVFIGFCMSKVDRIKKYLANNGETGYQNVSLTREEVKNRFEVNTAPTHFVIKNGTLVGKHIGPILPEGGSLEWMTSTLRQ